MVRRHQYILLGSVKERIMLNSANKNIQGLTLIEVLITITIASILMLMAMPGIGTWSNNQKIRSAAEGVLNGLQTARMEALKRNQSVEFVLTDSAPTAADVTASSSGKNWVVRVSTGGSNYDFISGWSGNSSSGASSSSVSYGSSVSTITFNSLGRSTSSNAINLDFSISGGGSCRSSGGDLRCLRVSVSTGGEVRMCDPSITANGDTRKC